VNDTDTDSRTSDLDVQTLLFELLSLLPYSDVQDDLSGETASELVETSTLEDRGFLGSDKGVVLAFADGSQFCVTVNRYR